MEMEKKSITVVNPYDTDDDPDRVRTFEVSKVSTFAVAMEVSMRDQSRSQVCLCCLEPVHARALEEEALSLGCESMMWSASLKGWGEKPDPHWGDLLARWPGKVKHRFDVEGHEDHIMISEDAFLERCAEFALSQGRRKLLRDSLPRVDEMGSERYQGKTLTVIGGVATRLLFFIWWY